MASFDSESATELFSRFERNPDFLSLEKKLFPQFSSEDIIEIAGGAGVGKTELLYHFIVCCIFPATWQGMKLDGLNTKVIFIDNDSHFDLFRLMTILERRLRLWKGPPSALIDKKQISSFIDEKLKLLHVVRCFDSDQFISTLCSIENTLSLKNGSHILMIDGLLSFYWSDRMRMLNNFQKISVHHTRIASLIRRISKKGRTPVFVTKRKLLNDADSDKKILGHVWRNAVTWVLELKYNCSVESQTIISLYNASNASTHICVIKDSGFTFLDNTKTK